MDDPMKIIWKYKNNNRRIQYAMYIFVGQVSNPIKKILEKIEDLNLYNTLITLTKQEYSTLEKQYGELWYTFFFNTHHIDNIISGIKETDIQRKEIIDKYGSDWFKKHIESNVFAVKKLLYSYASLIKDEKLKKTIKKGRTVAVADDDIDIDYTVASKEDIKKVLGNSLKTQSRQSLLSNKESKISDESDKELSDEEDDESINDKFIEDLSNDGDAIDNESVESDEETINDFDNQMIGGNKDCDCNCVCHCACHVDCNCTCHNSGDHVHAHPHDDDNSYDANMIDEDNDEVINEAVIRGGGEEEAEDNFEEGIDVDDLMSEEEMDLQEIEEMYKDVDANIDENIVQTSSLIKKALHDNDLFEKKNAQILQFDTRKDNDNYDEYLKDVYKKNYVTNQYIFKDDTIKSVKEKICCGFKNNSKFEEDAYLIPSRQYLWSEYSFNNKTEKVMIGQKWVKRNELLHVDVEPSNNFRVYEELRGNLKLLRDNLKRGMKIKWENDENNIIFDYSGYFTNNEIYMVDIYNELGKTYSPDPEINKNISDVYMQLYFKRIKGEDFKHIIEYLNGDVKIESGKIMTTFETINNDLIMENEIMNVVETVKETSDFKGLFKENYITQSVIHVNLRLINNTKIDLFRIFNEFIPTDKYPFIQYQTLDGQIIFKFKENEIYNYLKKNENMEVLSKWFENAPYGISFKIKINEKNIERFTAINLNENGRIEYKTQWKEEDMATIDDIKKTYTYVKDLIIKINTEKNRAMIEIPDDVEFKYAFINTIQKFELPEKYVINHNDLSEFSRFFYPYIALVIEPRKRQAKIQKGSEKSKFGTYLRYKRVSKYENPVRIEQRIMYFMRNYEYNDQMLASEISKQFNITEERSMEEIEKVRSKYPNIKRSRKVLKKLENIPKYKPPGIGIDIQGKMREKYKIRISGARDKQQLDRIIMFMNILIYLYTETYLFKKPDRQELKERLKKLNNIARRRNKVDEIVNYSKDVNTVKQMAQLDKRRIGFKPEKGQNQWTRSCQNSGNDKKRRPQQYNAINMDELIKKGYVYNKKNQQYERKIILKSKSGKKNEITIKTIKLQNIDEEGNTTGNDIHYTCSPDENGEHMYVGFLTRSSNPYGHCMPCCFKKDPTISKNKEKKEFYMRCMGQLNTAKVVDEKIADTSKVVGDRLYILQDTNKIQEGRFGFLPKYLDFYFNQMLEKEKKIKHHYLTISTTGYFFKYGSKQDNYQFINAIGSILNLSVEDIRQKIIAGLINDKSDQLFTSLNSGDIKTQFNTRDNFIDFIKNNTYLDYDMTRSIISIPKILVNGGLNIIVFQKRTFIIKRTLEKEKIKEDFYISCSDAEDIYNVTDPTRSTIFILKENKNYYPIVMVLKDTEISKSMDVIKTFNYAKDKQNIVLHVYDFFKKNCFENFLDEVVYKGSSLTAKETYHRLLNIKNKDYLPKYQVIDVRNKCKSIITSSGVVVPVRPTGSIYNLQIIKTIDKYITDFNTLYENLKTLYEKSNKTIPTKPIGVYYDSKTKNGYNVIAIMTLTRDIVPIKPEILSQKVLDDKKLLIENKPLFDKIDKEISKGKTNFNVDDRIIGVTNDKFNNEGYELFRLEFSDFINKPDHIYIKKKLESIMNNIKLDHTEKTNKIRLLLYKLINKDLMQSYSSLTTIDSSKDSDLNDLNDINGEDENNNDLSSEKYEEGNNLSDQSNQSNQSGQGYTSDPYDIILSKHYSHYQKSNNQQDQSGGKIDKFINLTNKKENHITYKISNDRTICKNLDSKDSCVANQHCHWTHSGCLFTLTKDMIIIFVNKISNELASNDLKAMEIMKIENYFVSDIVDYNRFTERTGDKIVRSSSNTIKKVLNDIFGKDNIPKIGKRRGIKGSDIDYQEMNAENPIKDLRDMFVQSIIPNNLSIFRAYVNGYYWLKHSFYDPLTRNIGHYSPLQTDIANYFKSLVMDWLLDQRNKKNIEIYLKNIIEAKKKSNDMILDFATKLGADIHTHTNCIVELYVLNKTQQVPIVVYDDNNEVIYIFDDGIVFNHNETKFDANKYSKYINQNTRKNNINIRFDFITNKNIPDEIETIYFK
jgi:hypothetical protein